MGVKIDLSKHKLHLLIDLVKLLVQSKIRWFPEMMALAILFGIAIASDYYASCNNGTFYF
jgi:hypothetical protein